MERGTAFTPLAQDPPLSASVAVRGSGSDLQRQIASIDASVAIGGIETMQGRLGRILAYPRFRAILLTAFAAFSVLLAAVGLYGVLAQFQSQRTHEIGVRIAVGAQPADVLRFIALRAGRPVALGIAVGFVAALALGRYLASLLYGVRSADPATLLAVCVLQIVIACLATLVPARRATRVDPMAALRNQ